MWIFISKFIQQLCFIMMLILLYTSAKLAMPYGGDLVSPSNLEFAASSHHVAQPTTQYVLGDEFVNKEQLILNSNHQPQYQTYHQPYTSNEHNRYAPLPFSNLNDIFHQNYQQPRVYIDAPQINPGARVNIIDATIMKNILDGNQIQQHQEIYRDELPVEQFHANNGNIPLGDETIEVTQRDEGRRVIDSSSMIKHESIINHPDYAPIPMQDLEECENCGNVVEVRNNPQHFENPNPTESSRTPAYSYHNMILNPYEQQIPQMSFIFHPTVIRVQQPHLILNELRHLKFQLDNSPIMNMLFSPATVPIPPIIPWPSNFIAQRYLPPKEFYEKHELAANSKEIEQPQSTTEPQASMRRAMPAPGSIEKSIQDSMAKNSAFFGDKFKMNFPVMPDIDSLIKEEMGKIKSQPKNSLVQIGNGNTNIQETSQTDNTGNVQKVKSMQLSDEDEEETTTKWSNNMQVMNQIKETTTFDAITATEEITEIPTTISEKRDESGEKLKNSEEVSTSSLPITSTLMEGLTTDISTDVTTTDSTTTEEMSTVESTTLDLADRIDPKLLGSLLG